MKTFIKVMALMAFGVLVISPPAANSQDKDRSEVVMKSGNMVRLFHNGTADEICLNDVIPVYRETSSAGHVTVKEVGQVKVLRYIDEHNFEAQVIKGNIKIGDVAKKSGDYCQIQPVQ